MNKKIAVLGIGLFLTSSPLLARDYGNSLYGNLEESSRRNEERREATRAVGERDTTRYIIGTDGRPAGYSQQEPSGRTHFYDQRGRWSGHTDR